MQTRRRISALFLLLLLISSLLPGCSLPAAQPVQVSPQAKLHTLLLDIAQSGADQLVPVIVQAQGSLDELVGSVHWTGSVITGNFPFINAVSALVPAAALLEIAQSPAVKWVSPNGPMRSTATSVQSVRDDFAVAAFNSNNGSQNWSADWVENDPVVGGAGPATGRVRIENGKLALSDFPDTGGQPSAARQVNLSAAADATLSFSYATTGGVDWEDTIALEISIDGINFVRLDTFTGIAGSTVGNRSYDISGFRFANTTIRFRVANMYGAANEQFLIDSVQIDFTVEDNAEIEKFYASQTPITGGTVKDDFSDVSYANNTGSNLWLAPWQESLDDNSPSGGTVSISGGSLEVKMDGTFGKSVRRTANLAGVNSAQLRYFLRNDSNLNSPDAVVVEASRDGGATWTTVTTVNANTAENTTHTFDLIQILGSVTSNTVVRFRQSAGSGTEKMRLESVEIEFQYITPQYNPVFVTWASALLAGSVYEWNQASNIVEPNGLGPDGLYGYGGQGKATFAGFSAQVTPGHRISKVELLVSAYATAKIKDLDYTLEIYMQGNKQSTIKRPTSIFDNYVGLANAGLVAVDLTGSRAWQWSDFYNDLYIQIEHSSFDTSKNQTIYYDAIGLRVTSTPGVDNSLNNLAPGGTLPKEAFDASKLTQAFPFAVRAPETWNKTPAYVQGQDMTVAIVDSGINMKVKDLDSRRTRHVNFNKGYRDSTDRYGHGTFVAVILAGDGKASNRQYTGIAPKANLINVRVSNDQGMSTEGNVLQALQWVFDNAQNEKIRVINLSLNAAVAQSYHTSPLAAGVEMLWLKGIVVVVSAGNNGSANLYPPANSPRVITVGATNDKGTPALADDVMAHFSAWGVDEAGQTKPDLVAPGTNIIAYLPGNGKLTIGKQHVENAVNSDYFRMSGTSMSAPMVAAAVAMLLQDEPNLTPDQVKFRLMSTANKSWPGYDPAKAGAGYLDIYAAVHGSTTNYANAGLAPSELLRPFIMQMVAAGLFSDTGFDWNSVNWNSVNWNSVNWNSVNWNSVNWNSVNWNSVNWNSVNWNSVNWNSVNWNSDHWDGSFDATQQVRDGMIQPILEVPEDQVEINRIFLPSLQAGQ